MSKRRHIVKFAAIAQLVERNLAKVEVAGPSPVCRSFFIVFSSRIIPSIDLLMTIMP